MPSVKLASQSLNVGIGSGGIRPSSISGSQYSGTRTAPQVNPNAALVNYTAMPVPQVIQDKTGEAALNMLDVWANSAFKYQERKESVLADEAVMQNEDNLRKLWAGYTDKEGNFVKGFSGYKGVEANDYYDSVVSGVDSSMESLVSSLDLGVRQKALLRLNSSRNTFLSRASTHNAKQLEFAEEQTRQVAHQQAYKEFEVDKERGWAAISASAATATTVEGVSRLQAEGMGYATGKIYTEYMQANPNDPLANDKALEASFSFFEAHREELSEEAESTIASTLLQKKQALDKSKGARVEKATKNYQARVEETGSQDVKNILQGGPKALVNMGKYTALVYNTWPNDPNKARQVISTHYKDALSAVLQEGSYEDAVVAVENLALVSKATGMFIGDDALVAEIKTFVQGPLYQQSQNKGRVERVNSKREVFLGISDAKTVQEVDAAITAMRNQNLPAETMSMLTGLSTNKKNEITKVYTDAQNSTHALNNLELELMADEGYSVGFEDHVYKLATENKITYTQASKLISRSKKASEGGLAPEYKSIKSDIKKLVSIEQMYYNPATREVGFWNSLESSEQESVEDSMEKMGRTPEQMQALAVSSIMQEYTRWDKRPSNRDKQPSEFVSEFFTTKQKQKGGIINAAKKLYNMANGPAPTMLFDTKTEEDLAPQAYEWGGDPQEQVPTKVLSKGNGTHVVEVASPKTSPISKSAPQAIEEYALSTIPDAFKSKYSDLPVNHLLAMQYVREQLIVRDGKEYFDLYSDAEKAQVVRHTLNSTEYLAWLSTKQ